MKNPNPINLATSAEVRKAGWQAETRDADGHLCRTHVPFETDEDIVWLVREALEHGETVTIWPNAIVSDTPAPQPHVVVIKPLVWNREDDMSSVEISVAYCLERRPGYCALVTMAKDERIAREPYPSVEDAKAAAQADYEARIRAVLSSPMGGGE